MVFFIFYFFCRWPPEFCRRRRRQQASKGKTPGFLNFAGHLSLQSSLLLHELLYEGAKD
jgi:hypothetical protein